MSSSFVFHEHFGLGLAVPLAQRATCCRVFFFFFNDTATTEIYTLSLHDALPISDLISTAILKRHLETMQRLAIVYDFLPRDRKSTRLNSSHSQISYAVFCLKKKQDHALLLLFLSLG